MATKPISQREARALRRRCSALEHLANMRVQTPRPRTTIARIALSPEESNTVFAVEELGAKLRWEQMGDGQFHLHAYMPSKETP